MTFSNRTFAIGESHVDIRQLAKVIWMFANIGETPPHSQLLKQRILIYDMDSCQLAEHAASFDPYLSDSTPADSIKIAQVDYR